MKAILTALLLASASGFVQAETLSLPEPVAGVSVPPRGMSMAAVERRFGHPRQKLTAVGEPPITRWVYPQYKVFFEHQYVIHSVIEKAR
jgi:hypothetical protein